MKLYTIYNQITGEVINCQHFNEGEQPINSTDLLCTENFIKAKFENGVFIEGASQEEIQTELITNAEITQQTLIEQTIIEQNTKVVLDAAQAETDVTKILENQAIYPLWDGNGKNYILKEKCQWFNGNNEMALWECVQPITSQNQFPPNLIPAHFKRVAKDGEILVWKQPLGSEDAYKIGDKVWFPTLNSSKYESLINANVYSPTDYPQGWKKL